MKGVRGARSESRKVAFPQRFPLPWVECWTLKGSGGWVITVPVARLGHEEMGDDREAKIRGAIPGQRLMPD